MISHAADKQLRPQHLSNPPFATPHDSMCHYKGRAGKRLCYIVKIVVDLVSWILEDAIYLCVKFRL